jgi:hypothetical protein
MTALVLQQPTLPSNDVSDLPILETLNLFQNIYKEMMDEHFSSDSDAIDQRKWIHIAAERTSFKSRRSGYEQQARFPPAQHKCRYFLVEVNLPKRI